MAPLFLLFDKSEGDLLEAFSHADNVAAGIHFGDGCKPTNASGTLIFGGVAFDYTIVATTEPDATARIFCQADLGKVRSAMTVGLGAAVASGQHCPSIITALLLLGERLGTALGAMAVHWTPASVSTGFSYYADVVQQYAGGAAFPVLVTIAFDAGEETIRTTGLDWLAGQELHFERDDMPVNEAMRYVVRIVHDLATHGAVGAEMEVPGMSADERLLLMPDAANRQLDVRRHKAANSR